MGSREMPTNQSGCAEIQHQQKSLQRQDRCDDAKGLWSQMLLVPGKDEYADDDSAGLAGIEQQKIDSSAGAGHC